MLLRDAYDDRRWGSTLEPAMLKPIFCIVLSDGENWLVEAEWPDGTIEPVDTFEGHSAAVDWLSTRSESWLQERTA
jgi:hypothetical protein